MLDFLICVCSQCRISLQSIMKSRVNGYVGKAPVDTPGLDAASAGDIRPVLSAAVRLHGTHIKNT